MRKLKTLAILSLGLVLASCKNPVVSGTSVQIEEKGFIKLGTNKFKRMNIEGVDCVIGYGAFDSAVVLSCDWKYKDDK